MKKYKNIYVAATSQHVGKTTSTLGLVAGFMEMGVNVGFCKPVGQKTLEVNNLMVDKDTILFSDMLGFEIEPWLHSPVILGHGATTEWLDNPTNFNFPERILDAKKELESRHELTIYEGTGHPGVGSICDISNAEAAKLLNASVVMVVEGGIGSCIDKLSLSMAMFQEQNVPIVGVIVNKVRPDKLEKVRKYVGMWLEKNNLPLLGIMPYDATLIYPIIQSVKNAVKGTIIFNAHQQDTRVEGILPGSLVDLEHMKEPKKRLLVVAYSSLDKVIRKIEDVVEKNGLDEQQLCGIVATGEGSMDSHTIEYIEKNELPLIRTAYDTYGCFVKISKIEVKINQSTPWKVKRAVEMINNNVNYKQLLG